MDTRERIELKSFTPNQGDKIHLIELTDIQFHTALKRASDPGKVIAKSINSNTPGRIYTPHTSIINGDNGSNIISLAIANSPELVKLVKQKQSEGYRVVVKMPKTLPLKLGDDAIEFLNSTNGKRIVRGREKLK